MCTIAQSSDATGQRRDIVDGVGRGEMEVRNGVPVVEIEGTATRVRSREGGEGWVERLVAVKVHA